MSVFGCKNCSKCQKKKLSPEIMDKLPKIALVGNPNVGKSVIFNALSGFYVEVSNYPGTTVDVSTAFTELGQIIDTPGAYSLGNYSDDETVTQTILENADIVINIVSALTIERDLFLTQQLIDMGFPIILAVNQMDETKKRGISIDTEKLGELLGIQAIPTVAVHKTGIAELINSIKNKEYRISDKKTPYIKDFLARNNIHKPDEYGKILEIECNDSENREEKDVIYSQRRQIVNDLIGKIIVNNEGKESISDIVGNLLLNPVIGTTVALVMLYLLFQLLGVFVAGNIVDFVFTQLNEKYSPWIRGLVEEFIPAIFINKLLVGEFGILTMTIEIVVGVLLPLITAFYLFMALLEDSGYLPRLAVLTDNILNKLGLNGRAVIPLLLGFGCGAMGTITTRILGSKKERTIATALIGITIPCAAQQGIIIALIAVIGGLKIWLLYLACIFTIMVLTGTVLNRLIPGKTTDLLIDLPPMRMPLILNTFSKTFSRVIHFLEEAFPVFAAGSLLVSVLNTIGVLEWLQDFLSPIVVTMLHLPEEFANVFIMGMIRRDFASVGLLEMAGLGESTGMFSDLQILVSSVVVTLFVPCLATLIVIYKERGMKEASLLWIGTFAISIIVGAVLTRTMGFIL